MYLWYYQNMSRDLVSLTCGIFHLFSSFYGLLSAVALSKVCQVSAAAANIFHSLCTAEMYSCTVQYNCTAG